MAKISQKIKTDKRTNAVIKADVLKTKIYLQYNNINLVLSSVEARRIGNTLQRAVAIQETNRKDTTPSIPIFSQQEVIMEQQIMEQQIKEQPIMAQILEPQKELTTLERRLKICHSVYQTIKEKHMDIPKFKESKINYFRPSICNSDSIGNAYAHAHNHSTGKYSNRICIKQKYLLDPVGHRKRAKYQLVNTNMSDTYENIADMMAHEIAHLTITSSSHGKLWKQRYNKLNKIIIGIIRSGDFERKLPEELKEK